MVVRRGEIWWTNLKEPVGSGPGYRRPAITSDLDLVAAPGNVALMGKNSGLVRDSVVNVSQVLTINRSFLTEFVGSVPAK